MSDQRYALVVMTNKDTYYLTEASADTLRDKLQGYGKDTDYFESYDAKSGSLILILTRQVSSVVMPRSNSRG